MLIFEEIEGVLDNFRENTFAILNVFFFCFFSGGAKTGWKGKKDEKNIH
jgi:hypothetical protein